MIETTASDRDFLPIILSTQCNSTARLGSLLADDDVKWDEVAIGEFSQ